MLSYLIETEILTCHTTTEKYLWIPQALRVAAENSQYALACRLGTVCPSSALASEHLRGADPCLKTPKYPESSAKPQLVMHSKTPLGFG